MRQMEIRQHQTDQIAILELAGRLTVNDQPGQVKEAIASALRTGARHVVLDLTAVRYLDSTRLGEIIAAHVTVSRQGGRLCLVGTPERILELLTIAGLAGVFERFDTADQAARQLQSET